MKDGGQAFPNEGFNGWGLPDKGMTLRDYFAAKAMQAYCSDPKWRIDCDMQETVNAAYRIADAMLKKRE